ncbi:hypothetical protein Tco_0973603 [Tanacetum coccineum]
MDVIAKLNDPQCELLLLRVSVGISKLYFAMRTALLLLLGLDLEIGNGGLPPYLFPTGDSVGYSAGNVLNYAFLASRLQSASLQTKLLRHSDIVSSGLAFDNALNAFNGKMDVDLLSNLSEIAAPTNS